MSNDMEFPIVLLPCNGLSARGYLSSLIAQHVQEQLPQVCVIPPVPLSVGIESFVRQTQEAQYIFALSGCSHRCESHICQQATGRQPDETLDIEPIVRKDVSEWIDMSMDEQKQTLQRLVHQALDRLKHIHSLD